MDGDDPGVGKEEALAGDLTQLMREIDSGFFGVGDRGVAERYWDQYLEPEIERLFAPGVEFQSHFEGPDGRALYTGYAGLRRWADDVDAIFSSFTRENGDWQPLGEDALLVSQRIEATGRESGDEIELRLWVLWLVNDDGRITCLSTFADRYEAEAAAGAMRLASR